MNQFFKNIAAKTGIKNMHADIVKGLRISFAVAALATTLMACQTPRSANAQSEPSSLPAADEFTGTQIDFDIQPDVTRRDAAITNAIKALWLKDPENKAYVSAFQTAPDFSLAKVDLNDDRVPEIFARHSDEMDAACNAQSLCRMHIYRVEKNGLVEIGRAMSADPVIIGAAGKDGYKNFATRGEKQKQRVYVWNGKKYQPK